MANPGTNTAIQALAKSGVTAHHKIEALQKQNTALMKKTKELVENVNKVTDALQNLTKITKGLMERLEVMEEVVMEREVAEDQAELERLATQLMDVLSRADNNPVTEIDPLSSAPPAYTSHHPLADNGGSAEPAPSSPESH